MMRRNKPMFIPYFLILVLLFSHLGSITTQETEDDELEFNYTEGSDRGPENWGRLKPEWFACKNGTRQSPIAIYDARVEVIVNDGDLKRFYKPANAILKNDGFYIELQWPNYSAGKIRVNETDYLLDQVHWHSPSEHTINGIRFDLELHMVHESLNPNVKHNISVIAFLYKIGPPDPFLSKLISSINFIADQLGATRNVGIIDPNDIEMHGEGAYYRYFGSLTTPPCSEVVVWTVKKKIGTVSRDQLEALRNAVLDPYRMNARPLQPINHREIQLRFPC